MDRLPVEILEYILKHCHGWPVREVCKLWRELGSRRLYMRYINTPKLMAWAVRSGYPDLAKARQMIRRAVVLGCSDDLRYFLVARVCKLSVISSVIVHQLAAASDHVHVLAALRDFRPRSKWHPSVCTIAVQYGNLALLKWLRTPRTDGACPWDEGTWETAVDYEQWEILAWMCYPKSDLEGGVCPWPEYGYERVLLEGQDKIADLMTESLSIVNPTRYPVIEDKQAAFEQAAKASDIRMLYYLHHLGFEADLQKVSLTAPVVKNWVNNLYEI